MNPHLKPVFQRSLEVFRADPRVLAAYHAGSVGTDREDELSDVDPILIVKADAFERFDADLRGIFAALGVTDPLLWWPERYNNETFRNYAICWKADGHLVQYDINCFKENPASRHRVDPRLVIFDKAGALEQLAGEPGKRHAPERLGWTVEIYLLYAYIHAKYLRRDDFYKTMYAQDELFQAHREVLRACTPEVAPEWWPLMVKHLPEEAQQTLRLYFGHVDVASVRRDLPRQLRAFARDARRACALWNVAYPERFEAALFAHLERHGTPVGSP